jgi:hypothetical protein
MINNSVILATMPSDCHSWNLCYMELFLREKGFDVINLGICTNSQQICDSYFSNFSPLYSDINIEWVCLYRRYRILKEIIDIVGHKHVNIVLEGAN